MERPLPKLPKKRVQRIGYVNFAELIDLIRGAKFCCLPVDL